jgi:hypothetical protein
MWLGDPDYCTGWLEDANYQVSESGYKFGVPEQVGSPDVGGLGLLEFPNSVRALLSGKSKSYFRFEFEIITDQNLLRVGNTQRELWLKGPSPLFEGFTELKRGEFAKLDGLNVFSEIARQLAQGVSTQMRQRPRMLCNEIDGLMALKTVLALHESHRRGSTPVHLQTLRSDIKLSSR